MLRWLVSIVAAALIFVSVALLLGYLLHKNKKETAELAHQIEQTTAAQEKELLAREARQEAESYFGRPIEDVKKEWVAENTPKKALTLNDILKVQITNLHCEQDAQCTFIHVSRNTGCALPINVSGWDELNKSGFDIPLDPQCSQLRFLAHCVNNRCEKSIP